MCSIKYMPVKIAVILMFFYSERACLEFLSDNLCLPGKFIFSGFTYILVKYLSQIIISKVGKKGAIYLPKQIIKSLGIGEGDRVLMRIEGNKLVLEFIPDPLSLALKVRRWAKTTVEEFERESESEQDELYGS